METIFDQFMALANSNAKSSEAANAGGEIVQAVPLPAPRCEVKVREATKDDLPFIDELQKLHRHMVGWMPTKQLEKYVEDGNVVVAEDVGKSHEGTKAPRHEEGGPAHFVPSCPRASVPPILGYCIARDQYMKRDDVGIVYQLNVAPMKQRHLIGATLVKAVFERAAYGCKLFCCWCAQDIQANWFWESIGFVPIAFRTGSRAKQRIHIFWQKRIREGDECGSPNATPYWYPHQTSGGAVAEDRLVLPIPPGTHWRDAKPLVLPGVHGAGDSAGELDGEMDGEVDGEGKSLPTTLPGGAMVKTRPTEAGEEVGGEDLKRAHAQRIAMIASSSKHLGGVPEGRVAVMTSGGVKYVVRPDYVPPVKEDEAEKQAKKKKPRRKAPRRKHDPQHLAVARELRDRFLDELNRGRFLPAAGQAKYAVGRQLAAGEGVDEGESRSVRISQIREDRLLDAADAADAA